MTEPIVAIVGRPNVGKSTLFNRLTQKRKSIVHSEAGITRDRVYETVNWAGRQFLLIDTGGFVPESADQITNAIREQVKLAVNEADLVIFMVDASEPMTALDREIAAMIRRSQRDYLVVANKCDNERLEINSLEFTELGLGEVFPISALNGRYIGDLLDAILQKIPQKIATVKEEKEHLQLAIVGMPNVGKSSILNVLAGSEKAIVTDIPGTTRDAIDTEIKYFNEPVTLIDTAGMRKQRRIKDEVEYYSFLRASRAIERCNVALVVIDAVKGFTRQDAAIVRQVIDLRKGLVIAINKWDLVQRETNTQVNYQRNLIEQFRELEHYPILFVSAKTHQRVPKILETARMVYENRKMRIETNELNKFLQDVINRTPPPANLGKFIKIKYVTQVKTEPPVFVFFCNEPHLIKEDYRRFLENQLRRQFGFIGVPLIISFRKK
ncbi:MAG TPA: ribosome biogenesis GTPase Der [Candidatus Marinimicrobia bacterium]|nr:ribosome biogenesis GTPase Der [Candidatus Neomarinimicrobiota bacterium]HRS51397.1 ribosome biogenesis GTPase Der [Candidatus Neomarinimicrobiota bacterium]HRU92231.1 ribosome biogenesis GTPase Der [Candidatus Neomarinimicrobiota bacterium]